MSAYGLIGSIEIPMCSASVNVTPRRIRSARFDSNSPDSIACGTPDTERKLFVPNVQFNWHRTPGGFPWCQTLSGELTRDKVERRGAAGITYSSPAAVLLCW